MKASRLILFAAAQLCCAGLMAAPAAAASMSTMWSGLWHTPDQQGQALLDTGHAAQAADRFQDPRRRAYADLQAGRYQDAAKLLAPFNDPESEYNRGNALAKSGQLQAALAAYDAALKQSPADKDIRRNRDLVERALRQKQQSARSSRNGQQGHQGAGSSGQQPRQSAGQQGGSASQQSGGASQQAGSASQRSGANGQRSAGGDQTASSGSQAGSNAAGQNSSPQQPGSPQAAGAYGSGTSKEPAGQAQRDAALAADLARKRQSGASGNTARAQASGQNGKSGVAPKDGGKRPDAGSLLAGGTQTPKQKPETERQLALDQWLRQIPDSPAGLLQRKFLIEHMMKQQGSGDPQDSGQ